MKRSPKDLLPSILFYLVLCHTIVAGFTLHSITTRIHNDGWRQQKRTRRTKIFHHPQSVNAKAPLDHGVEDLQQITNIDDITNHKKDWMRRGLLISSFHDGLLQNPLAQTFLLDSLCKVMWEDHQLWAEQAVRDSVVQSPCCGPNIEALERLEQVDYDWQALRSSLSQRLVTANHHDLPNNNNNHTMMMTTELRLVYIPTAMYAIRRDSQSTPGKQRQRARADAKQRRNALVQFLQEQFLKFLLDVNIHSVTLDLEDGSIKHPEHSSAATIDTTTKCFPKDGMEALQAWSPHLIYVEGGNTFWLHYCMKKGEWDPVLEKVCQTRAVYCGKSAGAILAGQTIETAFWKGWDDPSVVPGSEDGIDNGKAISQGLGLAGSWSFFPHMADEWKECVQRHVEDWSSPSSGAAHDMCCLTDRQACCIDGRAKTICVMEKLIRATFK